MAYIDVILMPLSILCIGLVLILFRSVPTAKRFGTYIAIIGGALMMIAVWFSLTYPSPKELDKREHLLFSVAPSDVDAVILEPTYDDNRSNLNLVSSAVKLTARNDIQRVISAIHGAERTSPNHPVQRWSCLLTIQSKGESVSVRVENTKSTNNGVLIYWWSDRLDGWAIGNYRCDALGPILEKLAKASEHPNGS